MDGHDSEDGRPSFDASTRRSKSKYFLLLRLLVSAVILFQSDSNVDCLMVSCVTTSCHHGLKFSVQASKKMILFLPVSIHILNSILRQVVETPNIMHHRVLPLLKSQELFQLHGHHTVWNIMCPKGILELPLVELVTNGLYCYQICPPGTSSSSELLCRKPWFLNLSTVD